MTKKIKRTSDLIFDIFNYIFFIFLSVIMLYPFWELLILSFSPAEYASQMGLKIVPKGFSMAAYKKILKSPLLKYGYKNSILRTVIGTVTSVFLCFCTSYPLSKKDLPARNILTLLFLIPMFFSGGLIPNFLLVRQLGLFDTLWALILPMLLGTYNILIMRNFIASIPESLEESALIDGASFFTILIKIIIPISKPVLATVGLWIAVDHWNSWFDAMNYTRSNEKVVLQLILRRMLIDQSTAEITDSLIGDEGVVTKSMEAATVLVAIGPIILTYPFLQKYFVKGVMVGSIKG